MAQRIQHTYLTLPQHGKCFALLSKAADADVRRAVIFIHGFNGNARGTWTDFLSLVDDPAASGVWWEAADLFFFHYQWDSVFRQLTNNTLKIYKFIEDVFPKPELIGRAHAYRSESFEYEELVLVGHSEGGLLLRKVIVEAAERDTAIPDFMRDSKYEKQIQPTPEGMLKAKLRLFAPALGGDMQSGLAGILASLPVVSHALSSSAAKKGMDQGSPSVTEARRRTDRYAEDIWFDCFRAHIIWAEKDSIINSEKYAEDKQCHNFPSGSSHTSVCKPTLTYPLPLAFVEEGVDRYECK
jgi:pimeloyl-ACP methyl ester carboxylesterase